MVRTVFRRLVRPFVIAICVVALGCSAPSLPTVSNPFANHHKALDQLRRDVGKLPGVDSVQAQYDYGGLEGSSASLSVRLVKDAPNDQVVAAAGVVLRGFATEFGNDSADASIQRGRDALVLHAKNSEVQGHQAAVLLADGLALKGETQERVSVELDVRREIQPQPRGIIRLTLPSDSRESEVVAKVRELRTMSTRTHAEFDVVVVAADGSGLGATGGVPSESDVRLWQEVTKVGEGHAVVLLEPHYYYPMQDRITLVVTLSYVGGRRQHRAEIIGVLSEQLRMVRRHTDRVTLSATVNGEETVWLSTELCYRGPRGSIQRGVATTVFGPSLDTGACAKE